MTDPAPPPGPARPPSGTPSSGTPPLAVHVGYPKCASTSLQGKLFARHPQIHFLHRAWGSRGGTPPSGGRFHEAADTRAFFDALHDPGPAGDEAAPALFDRHVRPFLGAAAAGARVTLFSSEHLTAGPPAFLDRTARRLRATVGPAKVVVVVRGQFEAARSRYEFNPFRRVLGEDRGARPPSFADWLRVGLEQGEDSMLAGLRYARTLDLYRELFGADAVRPFLFEELIDPHRPALAELCGFLGVDAAAGEAAFRSGAAENQTSAVRLHLWRRRLIPGRAFTSRLLPPAWRSRVKTLAERLLRPRPAVFPEELKPAFHALYAADNAALFTDQSLHDTPQSVRAKYPGFDINSI